MSIHGHRVFTDWVISTLTTGGLTVGNAHAPKVTDPLAGYVVVYPIAGGITRGTLDAPRSDAEPNIQLSSVSATAEQAMWLADKARELLDAAVPADLVDGRHVFWIDFPMASITLRRDDDAQPPSWIAIDRFEMGTTPG